MIDNVENLIQAKFATAAIKTAKITLHKYPDETFIVVYVHPTDIPQAADLALQVDQELDTLDFKGCVAVRPYSKSMAY